MAYQGIDRGFADVVRHRVKCGFDDEPTIFERITEQFDDVAEADVEKALSEALAAHERERATWSAITDCDRLDRAFAALDRDSIFARQHWACCQNCGVSEIREAIADRRLQAQRVDGYAFYHWQDTDSVVEDGVLHVRYGGSFDHDDAQIGHRVAAALRNEGLAVTWDGNAHQTIEVAVDWKRRGPPSLASEDAPTAESCVAAWCAAFPAATIGTAANLAGDLPLALETAGMGAAADAWARAHYRPRSRAVGLARLASARRSPELLLEAWQVAPWDREGTFVELLTHGSLDDTRVRKVALAKIAEARRDTFGGAAAAWCFARLPDVAAAERNAREAIASSQNDYDGALLALRAGLWRAGDEEQRDQVLELLPQTIARWAHDAASSAAQSADDLRAMSSGGLYGVKRSGYERLIELGLVDEARELATENDRCDELLVAWLTGDRECIAGADLEALAENLSEGLITPEAYQCARLAVAACAGAESASKLAELAREALTATVEDADLGETYLRGERVAPTAKDETRLQRAIASWQAAADRRARMKERRSVTMILEQATYLALTGDAAGARALIAMAIAPYEEDLSDMPIAPDALVIAWAALGDVDQLGRISPYWTLGAKATAAFVGALVRAAQSAPAIEKLSTAIQKAVGRSDFVELIPAVLAVDPAARARLRGAWDAADAALAGLGAATPDGS